MTSPDRKEVSSDPEVLKLKIRNAIADKEWITASANRETACYGAWQCDWYGAMRDAESRLEELFAALDALLGRGG